MRSGVIAKKVGMTRIFDDTGDQIPVTVLRLENCQVISHLTAEKNGYTGLQLGVGKAKVKNTTRPMRGHFAKAEVEPKQKLAEFRVSEENLIDVGLEITADHFVSGQFVDVTGTSIGKGFAGAMKRHHFGGLGASHGVSVSHRAHGSTGQCQDPGRVFKGKKMAGHMGDVRRTTQNLRIAKTDPERGLILVKGTIPGSKGRWILVKDAVKKDLPTEAPLPGAFRKLDPYAIVEPEPVQQEESAESTETTVSDAAENIEVSESSENQTESTATETTGADSTDTEVKKQSVESDEKKEAVSEQSADDGQESVADESKQEVQETSDNEVVEQSSVDTENQGSITTSIEDSKEVATEEPEVKVAKDNDADDAPNANEKTDESVEVEAKKVMEKTEATDEISNSSEVEESKPDVEDKKEAK